MSGPIADKTRFQANSERRFIHRQRLPALVAAQRRFTARSDGATAPVIPSSAEITAPPALQFLHIEDRPIRPRK